MQRGEALLPQVGPEAEVWLNVALFYQLYQINPIPNFGDFYFLNEQLPITSAFKLCVFVKMIVTPLELVFRRLPWRKRLLRN